MSEFEKLAEDLETLAKSQLGAGDDADADEKIAAAADESAVGAGDGGGSGGSDDDDDEDDEVLGKSFSAERGGERVRVFDATELIKSMGERLETIEMADAENRMHLGKSMGLIADMLKSQAEEIATLKKSISELGNEGRGRKTVLSVTEKTVTTLAKSDDAPVVGNAELMAKCLSAQKAGRLTGIDVARANVAVESGMAVPQDILARLPE